MKHEMYELWWENNLGKSYTHNDTRHSAPDEEGFVSWMGDPLAIDRQQVRSLLSKDIESLLDVGCGAAPEHIGLQKSRPDIEYFGVDITPRLVDYCQKKGINVVLGTARNLPFDDSSVDVVNARHLIEHMANFREPLKEFLRVARKKVHISFFIAPVDESNGIITDISEMDVPCYNNAYSLPQIKECLDASIKVTSYRWHALSGHSKCLLCIDVDNKDNI